MKKIPIIKSKAGGIPVISVRGRGLNSAGQPWTPGAAIVKTVSRKK